MGGISTHYRFRTLKVRERKRGRGSICLSFSANLGSVVSDLDNNLSRPLMPIKVLQYRFNIKIKAHMNLGKMVGPWQPSELSLDHGCYIWDQMNGATSTVVSIDRNAINN